MADIYIQVKSRGFICVPASPGHLSTYVLLEQEDWFEKEIAFVRRVLRTGMNAVDVGANHGLYTLAMARAVGDAGRVWAFEPGARPAGYLKRTIDRNRLDNVALVELALSDHAGTGHLAAGGSSELGALQEAGGDTEPVPVSTLDHALTSFGGREIDFLKIDAEGQEAAIVRGGRRLLREMSPLVMIELKHAAVLNLPALQGLTQLGYRLFRLVGPDLLLVPFRLDEPVDAYELNVFAARPDRMAALSAAGYLIAEMPTPLPAGNPLDSHARWQDRGLAPTARYQALVAGLDALAAIPPAQRSTLQLATLARVASEAGRRQVAFEALQDLVARLDHESVDRTEGALPPAARYDRLDPGGDRLEWLRAAATEALEVTRALSGYFSPGTILPRLDWLQTTRFASAPIERRRQLQRLRAGEQRAVLPHWTLEAQTLDNLNPSLWVYRR